jgi:D-sedoheptulose 7-phosphate isomerase
MALTGVADLSSAYGTLLSLYVSEFLVLVSPRLLMGRLNLIIHQVLDRYMEQVRATIAGLDVETIGQIVEVLHEARIERRRIFIFGNGGSAATASHFACDLNKGAICSGQPRFRAIALTDCMPLLSAWANDTAYENIFAQQLENHVEPGDVVIGISGSGNSMNVVNALKLANIRGATTIALTGFDGGKVKDIAHICLIVRNNSIEQVEDIHLLLGHAITTCLRLMSAWPSHVHIRTSGSAGGKTDVKRLASVAEP